LGVDGGVIRSIIWKKQHQILSLPEDPMEVQVIAAGKSCYS
jgi:hypothetical protein